MSAFVVRRPTPWYTGLVTLAWPAIVLIVYAVGWCLAAATTAPRQPPTVVEVENIGIVR